METLRFQWYVAWFRLCCVPGTIQRLIKILISRIKLVLNLQCMDMHRRVLLSWNFRIFLAPRKTETFMSLWEFPRVRSVCRIVILSTSREKFLPIVIKRSRILINYIRLCTSCYDLPNPLRTKSRPCFNAQNSLIANIYLHRKKKKKKVRGQIVIFNPRPPKKKMPNDRKHQNYKYRKIIGMS